MSVSVHLDHRTFTKVRHPPCKRTSVHDKCIVHAAVKVVIDEDDGLFLFSPSGDNCEKQGQRHYKADILERRSHVLQFPESEETTTLKATSSM